jgi:hypothetical protein
VKRRCGLVTTVVALCAACGGDAAISPMAPTVVGVYQGSWRGETSQSGRFGFVVSGDYVSQLEFDVSYGDTSCQGGLNASQSLGPLVPISNAEFSASYANPRGDFTCSMAGRFESAVIAAGTLHVTITRSTPASPASGCQTPNIQVTWAAQKGP